MTERPLAVLVIGAGMYVCGRGASTYGTVLPTLVQAQARGTIGNIAVVATSRDSIEALQTRLGELNARMGTHVQVKGYPAGPDRDPLAYRRALEELPRPACAIVVVPDHLHASITADVIRAGVHPLVVKPLTPTVKEARQLIELGDDHDVYGAVEFHKRFDETNLLLRQTVADGCLGNVCYVTVEYSQRRVMREIFRPWLDRTNIFQYLGVHYVDLIHFITGGRPVRALAMGQVSGATFGESPVYDAIQAMVEWQDPTTGRLFVSTIATNWIDPDSTSAMSDQKITVIGTQGRYQADQKHRGVQLVTQQGGVEDLNPYFSQLYEGADGDFAVHGYGPRSIWQFLADVRDLVAGRCRRQELVEARPSFKNSLASTAVIEAVNRSLLQGGEWVAIEESSLATAIIPPASEGKG